MTPLIVLDTPFVFGKSNPHEPCDTATLQVTRQNAGTDMTA